MVFEVIDALNVPLTPEIATHIYIAILTDTGGFHYGNITPAHVRDLPSAARRRARILRPSPARSTTATRSAASG